MCLTCSWLQPFVNVGVETAWHLVKVSNTSLLADLHEHGNWRLWH